MPPSSSASPIITQAGARGSPLLRFLHYNDVYHIEAGSRDPVGGAARFQTMVDYYRSDAAFAKSPALLTFFSGDAYNPSLESSVTKGRHMVPILNGIGTDVACNHDLDFGVPIFRHLASKCTFPWLLGNVLDPSLGTDVSLGGCAKTMILTASNGIKVGVVGLVEREWLDTINSLPPDLIYKSASATALELVPSLREQGAEIVVAVTHMREPNDVKLATNTPPGFIDIILGGHDHYYNHQVVNGTHVLRSGSDFRQLSYIEAWKSDDDQRWLFNITRSDVTRDIPENPTTVALIDQLTSSLKTKLEKPLGYTSVPLDGRFTTVRRAESNLGNFICDLMRFYYETDCAIMASGTIRGDQVYPPGVLKIRDIMSCFPFEDPVVSLRTSGRAITAALENGVSNLPALEGRFPQVSNIVFEFDMSLPVGSRILRASIGGSPIELDKTYLLATRGYMARGKDGYRSLLMKSAGGEAEEVVDEENGLLLSTIVRQYFMGLEVIGKWRHWGETLDHVWGSVVEKMSEGGSIHEPTPVPSPSQTSSKAFDIGVDGGADDGNTHALPPAVLSDDRSKLLARKYARKWLVAAGISPDSVGMVDSDGRAAGWTRGITPKLEGRIIERRGNVPTAN
ncbi:hypothetical protein GP486_001104 [Trichoglossum hirsutum]|uniref:5'-Nucleotidase C-terminal domain-containing protein n=1 Tax=Trichoglossum hirsutum TaxID=265104 RepID=A0A9P8LGK4_9PEZI|nr:hypothetical protein GP486_001104 [Trichoglossum hirsutum]